MLWYHFRSAMSRFRRLWGWDGVRCTQTGSGPEFSGRGALTSGDFGRSLGSMRTVAERTCSSLLIKIYNQSLTEVLNHVTTFVESSYPVMNGIIERSQSLLGMARH